MLWEKTKKLWVPPSGVEYVEIGDWQHPFQLSIPPEAVDAAVSAVCLREWKVIWRLEVAVDHQPIPFVGWRISKVYNLNLHNFRLPILPPLSPPQAINLGSDTTAIQIFLTSPHGAFGPGDTFSVSFHAKSDDPATIVKKAVVVLERKVELLEDKAYPSNHSSRDMSPESACGSRLSSVFRRSASPRPYFHRILSDSSTPAGDVDVPGRVVRDKIAEVVCEQPTPGSGGTYWYSTTIQLPKRGGKWDLGETVVTRLVSVTFELRLRVIVKTTKSRTVSKEYSCEGVPVTIAAVSAADRMQAMSAVALTTSTTKPLSSSSRRRLRSTRRGLYMQEGTVDISDPVHHRRRTKTRSVTSSPILISIAETASDVKPILLPPDHPAQSQSISFIFPSTRPNDSPPEKGGPRGSQLPPINTHIPSSYPDSSAVLIPGTVGYSSSPQPISATVPTSGSTALSPLSTTLLSPPNSYSNDCESFSILRKFQHSGRRISTTTSEEEEMQPSRTRQKVREEVSRAEFDLCTTLPSLDALGLGLPQVPEERRPIARPRTAPMHSTFVARAVPPPITGALSIESIETRVSRPVTDLSRSASDTLHGGTFAFTILAEGEGK